MRECITRYELHAALHEMMTDADSPLTALSSRVSPEALAAAIFSQAAAREARRTRELTRAWDGK